MHDILLGSNEFYKKIEQNVNSKLEGVFYNTSAYIQQGPSVPPSLPILLPVQVALSKAVASLIEC